MPRSQPFRPVDVDVDIDRLAAAVDAFPSVAWHRDPAVPGRSFVALVARRGDHTDDRIGGISRPTTWFEAGSYLAEVIGSLGLVIGRLRIVRERAGSEGGDPNIHPFWAEHDVIRIPVGPAGDDGPMTVCGSEERRLRPGTAWRFDGLHHLVHRRHDASDRDSAESDADDVTFVEIVTIGRAASDEVASIEFERFSAAAIDPPGRLLVRAGRVADVLPDSESADLARRSIDEFVERWRSAWIRRDSDPTSVLFAAARDRLRTDVAELDGELVDGVGVSIRDLVVGALAAPSAESGTEPAGVATDERFDRPVFVVGTPRAGVGRLKDSIAAGPDVVSLRASVRSMIGRVRASAEWDRSDRIAAASVRDGLAHRLRDEVHSDAVDEHGAALPMNATGLRLVDADPRNAVCIEMLDRVFPDARFVFVTRDPRTEIAELYESWISDDVGRTVDLPGWDGPGWTSVIPPGWQDWAGLDPLEIAAHQWVAVARAVLDDLDRVAPGRWTAVDHDVLVARPRRELRRILRFAGLDPMVDEARTAPLGRHRLVSSGRALSDDQWSVVEPIVSEVATLVAKVVDVRPDRRMSVGRPAPAPDDRSVALAELLHAVDASLLVVGGDSGTVVVVGSDGEHLHVDDVHIPGARAVAVPGRREIVVATTTDVLRYRKQRRGVRSGAGVRSPESLYVLRSSHHTGVVDAHEMAVDADGEAWVVATRFSCLATLDDEFSFVPRWVPGFVSRLSADDRCHLNGLAMRDGRPRYVTSYSESDLAGGWRDTATFGGVVVDVEADEVVVRGLCMPHSPRWHDGSLWALESGSGTLGRVDLDAGRFEPVVELPGFARGLAMVGRYAVVATSGLRPATTSGLPLAEGDRRSRVAVLVVDLEEASIVGVLPLRARIAEISDVQLVPGGRLHLAEHGSEHHLHSVVVPPTRWADGSGSPADEV